MNIDAEKWDLLEKAHDYRFVLRLLGFFLVADLLLALATGSNLWTFRWTDVSDRPGVLITAVLAYGVVMTLGSAAISWLAMGLLSLIVLPIQNWLNLKPDRPEFDSQRHVTWMQAEAWLAEQEDASRRAPVEKQMADWRKDRQRWFSLLNSGWACCALVLASFWVRESGIAQLSLWRWWAPWVVMLVPALPCVYHVWDGMPGNHYIELPELARKLSRRPPAFNKGAARD